MTAVCPVILCGGSGTRLWPLSRAGFPKQFLCLQGQHSLFQNTLLRLLMLHDASQGLLPSIVVMHEDHRFLAMEQLRDIRVQQATLILEPVGRNTSAALTLAALQATEAGADAILVASPSDHFVADGQAYTRSLQRAIHTAEAGAIAVLGITPSQAETGYGYIQFEASGLTGEEQLASRVIRFVEKPSLELAEQYLAAGDYAWNGGIFVIKASVWLQALQKFRPDIYEACKLAWGKKVQDQISEDIHFVRPDAVAFEKVPSESIDYAVMEKCPGSGIDMQMVALRAGWSDLGAWDAVWQVGAVDGQGNVCQGDVMLEEAHGNLVHASSRLVAVVGVSNLTIIETADAVLVADRKNSQQVKAIVTQLGAADRAEHISHRKVQRPWGWADLIDRGERFKVRRICVKVGASLSLQKHAHRAEHWIIVKGQAQVVCGDKHFLLTDNQSTFIPAGVLHQLTNSGEADLEMIEIQSGELLSEDDVFRV